MGIATECPCAQWKANMAKLDPFWTLAWAHGFQYDGDIFVFCPWCGQKLLRHAVPDAELEVRKR